MSVGGKISFSVNSAMKESWKIVFANAFFLLRGDGALDRDAFGAFDDGGDDGAAKEIAAIKRFLAPAAQCDFEKFIFFAPRKLPFEKTIDQSIERFAKIVGFFREHAVVGKISA